MFDLGSHTVDTLIMCISLILAVGMFGLLLIKLTKLILEEQARLINITYDYYESNLELLEKRETKRIKK